MKKYNISISRKLKKEKIELSIVYILSFLLIFLLLGFVSTMLINNIFFKNVKSEIHSLKEGICNELREEVKNDKMSYQLPKNVNYEARINFILYQEDYESSAVYYTSNIMNYFIPEFQDLAIFGRPPETYNYLLEQITSALSTEFFDLNYKDMDKFVLESVETNQNKYYFYTLSFKVEGNSNLTASDIKYAKVAMMVNGEISSEQKINKIYYICAGVMFALATAVAITLAMRAIKPIEESLAKEQEFVGNASHELRTPLSIVQSKLENILTRSDEKIYDVSDDIVISLNEISRLNKLVRELLTLSKDDANGLNLDLKELNITELIKDIASPFVEMANIDDKEFNITGGDIIVKADEALIRQLIIIILDNALRYTNPKDKIDILIQKDNNNISVEIADTGIGISEETKRNIFERFYREDKARSRATGGNGLGMAIAQTIVVKHKGRIYADHNMPKGTKITFTIPLK